MRFSAALCFGLCVLAVAAFSDAASEERVARNRRSADPQPQQQLPSSASGNLLRRRQQRQSNGHGHRQSNGQSGETGGSDFDRLLRSISRFLSTGESQRYDTVSFSSPIFRITHLVLGIIQNQARALTHFVRALGPIDSLLSDQGWRAQQVAMMRQETGNTFNVIMDIVLSIVRLLMNVFGGGANMLAL